MTNLRTCAGGSGVCRSSLQEHKCWQAPFFLPLLRLDSWMVAKASSNTLHLHCKDHASVHGQTHPTQPACLSRNLSQAAPAPSQAACPGLVLFKVTPTLGSGEDNLMHEHAHGSCSQAYLLATLAANTAIQCTCSYGRG